MLVRYVASFVKAFDHLLRCAEKPGGLHSRVSGLPICRLGCQPNLALVAHHHEDLGGVDKSVDMWLSLTDRTGRVFVDKVLPIPYLPSVMFGAKAEMRATLLEHGGNTTGIHLLETNTNIPNITWSARRATH